MRFTRAVYIRSIALIYVLAFLSIGTQMLGLYGENGILPFRSVLARGAGENPVDLLLNYPSVFWWNSSDAFLSAVPLIGAALALIALLGVGQGPCLVIAWFLYLSIVTVGQNFMSFQWDILLLEAGFLAIFLSSWRPFDFLFSFFKAKLPDWSIDKTEPAIVLIWLHRWLLFRLMFQSGLVKIQSGDETWHDLTAMTFHYETQPLPTPIGWLAHQLPEPLHLLSTLSVFVLELLVPLLIFAGRRARCVAAFGLVSLQLLIVLTGNYCFFNWLTIALCLLLFDDGHLLSAMRTRFSSLVEAVPKVRPDRLRIFIMVPLAVLIVFLSTCRGLLVCGYAYLPSPLYAVMALTLPWHLVNSYGLFAVMTTSRPEISIEGSIDGEVWKEYLFKYKPGPLERAPPIVAPHQPRLDWQMWFAALGTVFHNQWLIRFAECLLENSPEVVGLLETNPFPDEPPKYVRAVVYDYHMTDIRTLVRTGNWWKRQYKSEYLPPISKE